MKKYISLLGIILTALLGAVNLHAQTTVDTVCVACVPITSTHSDSTLSRVDSTYSYFTKVDTTGFRDSVVVICANCVAVTKTSPDSTLSKVTPVYTYFTKTDTIGYRDSTVTIVVPPVATSCPNQPTGWTLIDTRNYKAPDSPVWSNVSSFSLVADPTAPDGDGSVGRMFYSKTGRRVGSATMSTYYTPTLKGQGYKGLYACFWQKVDNNFQLGGGGAQGTKQFWFLVGSSAENRVLTGVDGKSSSGYTWGIYPARITLALQGLGNVVSTAWNGGAISRGVWNRVELLGQLESSKGATDGYIKLFINGKQVTQYTNLQFTKSGETLEWFGFKWNNTIGGGLAPCTTPTWAPTPPATSVTLGAYTYTANNGVLPTQAAHPECFYPVDASIYMDAQQVWGHK